MHEWKRAQWAVHGAASMLRACCAVCSHSQALRAGARTCRLGRATRGLQPRLPGAPPHPFSLSAPLQGDEAPAPVLLRLHKPMHAAAPPAAAARPPAAAADAPCRRPLHSAAHPATAQGLLAAMSGYGMGGYVGELLLEPRRPAPPACTRLASLPSRPAGPASPAPPAPAAAPPPFL